MREDAQNNMDSLGRRYAKLEDITVNNVIYANREAKTLMLLNLRGNSQELLKSIFNYKAKQYHV